MTENTKIIQKLKNAIKPLNKPVETKKEQKHDHAHGECACGGHCGCGHC